MDFRTFRIYTFAFYEEIKAQTLNDACDLYKNKYPGRKIVFSYDLRFKKLAAQFAPDHLIL